MEPKEDKQEDNAQEPEDNLVVTKHGIVLDAESVDYTVTAGTIVLKEETKEEEKSAGEKAKFGLTAAEIVRVIGLLEQSGKRDWLKLLHYHVGSQITSIGAVTRVLREATRVYTEMARLCPSMCMFNAGGGLGVDYDGSRTSSDHSVNYGVTEYANDVVFGIHEVCEQEEVEPPTIVSESGRMMSAYHALLVVDVRDTISGVDAERPHRIKYRKLTK